MPAAVINAEFAPAFQPLFQPARYKVYYGGRGGAKSWAFARALLIRGVQEPLRVLCAREQQNSITESVHKLLKDQIAALGLDDFYTVLQNAITGPNGTSFAFEGIKLNVNKIKSYEGVDVCWVEEANLVSKNSWDVLIPTIRKPNSEIWISFNPERQEDETYVRFVLGRPPNSIVQRVTWRDNPWFPETLRAEMEHCKATNYDDYLWIWEGHCKVVLDGAVYMREIRRVLEEGRYGTVRYDRNSPVDLFFDLGRSDNTAIWFRQYVAGEYRYLHYYQNSRYHIDHYIQYVQGTEYTIGTVWLPHDAKSQTLGSKVSIQGQVVAKFPRVRIVPKLKKIDGINAARAIFPNCWFDQAGCAKGFKCLQEYKYALKPGTQIFGNEPLHDEFSDGADAFRYSAVAAGMARVKFTPGQAHEDPPPSAGDWIRDGMERGLGWLGM
jgi:phage terminase large subunit